MARQGFFTPEIRSFVTGPEKIIMAKNYVQAGTTLAITATAAVKSGDLVQAGDVFVVAVTDIAAGATGDGIAHGVFWSPNWPPT